MGLGVCGVEHQASATASGSVRARLVSGTWPESSPLGDSPDFPDPLASPVCHCALVSCSSRHRFRSVHPLTFLSYLSAAQAPRCSRTCADGGSPVGWPTATSTAAPGSRGAWGSRSYAPAAVRDGRGRPSTPGSSERFRRETDLKGDLARQVARDAESRPVCPAPIPAAPSSFPLVARDGAPVEPPVPASDPGGGAPASPPVIPDEDPAFDFETLEPFHADCPLRPCFPAGRPPPGRCRDRPPSALRVHGFTAPRVRLFPPLVPPAGVPGVGKTVLACALVVELNRSIFDDPSKVRAVCWSPPPYRTARGSPGGSSGSPCWTRSTIRFPRARWTVRPWPTPCAAGSRP